MNYSGLDQVIHWNIFDMDLDEESGMCVLCLPLPKDGEEILVSDGVSVWQDTFMQDGMECWLDSSFDIGIDAIAWAHMPDPPLKTSEESD